jgi:hypothetical protein
MSDGKKPTTPVPDYDHGRIATLYAAGQQGTSLVISCYEGNSSIKVYKDKERIKSIALGDSLKRRTLAHIVRQAIKLEPDNKQSVDFLQRSEDGKSYVPDVTLVIGRDKSNIAYIGLTGSGIPQLKFPLRLPRNVSVSQVLDEADASTVMGESLASILESDLTIAGLISSKKRDFSGNKSGGYGSGNRYGNNNNNGRGKSTELNDDVPF